MAESGNSLVIELQSDLQNIFPAAHHCCQQRHHQLCGFPDLCRLPRGPDDLVPLRASCGRVICAIFCTSGVRCCPSGSVCGSPHLWSSIVISVSLSRSLSSSAFISPQSASRAASFPERFRLLYALNPMVGVIDGFRWCLLGAQNGVYWPGIAVAVIDVIVLVASGIWYFRKTEQTFADVI